MYKDSEQQKEWQRRYYQRNKSAYRERSRKSKQEKFEYVKNLKKQSSCEMCNEDDWRCLCFHHRDMDSKRDKISHMVTQNRSLDSLKEEIKKCSILCMNCHMKIHIKI